jgi:hypothetical protein
MTGLATVGARGFMVPVALFSCAMAPPLDENVAQSLCRPD